MIKTFSNFGLYHHSIPKMYYKYIMATHCYNFHSISIINNNTPMNVGV